MFFKVQIYEVILITISRVNCKIDKTGIFQKGMVSGPPVVGFSRMSDFARGYVSILEDLKVSRFSMYLHTNYKYQLYHWGAFQLRGIKLIICFC